MELEEVTPGPEDRVIQRDGARVGPTLRLNSIAGHRVEYQQDQIQILIIVVPSCTSTGSIMTGNSTMTSRFYKGSTMTVDRGQAVT